MNSRIYQPGKNIHPKLLAIFPFGFGLALAGQLVHGHQWVAAGGLLLMGTGIWTFFGRSERYIDLVERKVVTRKQWLWFTWGQKLPLSHYTHLAVVIAASGNRSIGFDVNLVGKDARSNHSGNLSTNMFLATFRGKSGGKQKAVDTANDIARRVGLDVHIDLPDFL